METKGKEQSDSKRRQWLTTSLTGHSRTKYLEALRLVLSYLRALMT